MCLLPVHHLHHASLCNTTLLIKLAALQAQICSPQPQVPALEASQMQRTHLCNRTQTPDVKKSRQRRLHNHQAYKPGILRRGIQVINGQVPLNGRRHQAAWLSLGLAAPTGRLPRAAPTSPGPQVPNGPRLLLISLSLQSQTGALPTTSLPTLRLHPTMTAYLMGTCLLHHYQHRSHPLSQALAPSPMVTGRQCKSLQGSLMLATQPYLMMLMVKKMVTMALGTLRLLIMHHTVQHMCLQQQRCSLLTGALLLICGQT